MYYIYSLYPYTNCTCEHADDRRRDNIHTLYGNGTIGHKVIYTAASTSTAHDMHQDAKFVYFYS